MDDVEFRRRIDHEMALVLANDMSKKSTTKYFRAAEVLADYLDQKPEHVYCTTVSKPANASVRLGQSDSARRPWIGACFLTPDAEASDDADRYVSDVAQLLDRREKLAIVFFRKSSDGWQAFAVNEASNSTVGDRIRSAYPNVKVSKRPVTVDIRPRSNPIVNGSESVLHLEARTRRMLRLAIAGSKAVLAVGPPGTGKTTLVVQVLQEINEDPRRFGFDVDEIAWRLVTAQEDWSFETLVARTTVRHGELAFEPGLILQALAEDEWVVLDEMNRADSDKIFGGLLTWLSGKATSIPGLAVANGVTLAWSDEQRSRIENEHGLYDDDNDDPVVYSAGSNWRLLGTYNAVDAQRVFRFGQALGRRFQQVPVPPATTEQFRQAIEDRFTDLEATEKEAVVHLYDTHRLSEATALGPALFLPIADYLLTARRLAHLCDLGDGSSAELGDLVAEGYIQSAGNVVARFEDEEIALLGADLIARQVFTPEQWEWVQVSLSSFRA
jgi:MoxR-like ATPase